MRCGSVFGVLAFLGGCLIGSAALAADWQIASVSGKAFRLSGTSWVRVAANEPIALGDTIRTLGSATLTLARDGVTVTVAPGSQVQIKERMDGKFTDVLQTAGSAAVEVDPAKHIRLAVETPYMAAVVKGTVFAVSTYPGYSETAVQRGRVAVIDVRNRMEVDVTAGQTATSGPDRPLSVTGTGKLRAPEPFKGKVVTQQPDGSYTETPSKTTETINGAGKTVSSNAGGKSNGAGNSENSQAGGNAGGNSGKGNSGNSGNANSSGNSGSNGSSSGSNNSSNGSSSGSNSGSNGHSSGSNNSSNGSSSGSNSGSNGKSK